MANTFNLGRDGAKITIVDSVNGNVTLSGMVEFGAKSRAKEAESEGIDGITKFRNAPAGWEGDFKFDREDASVDVYFDAWETSFYAGLPPPEVVITQTVNETDGSRTKWQYQGVTLKLSDGGTWKGLDKVSQSIGWKASRRIRL